MYLYNEQIKLGMRKLSGIINFITNKKGYKVKYMKSKRVMVKVKILETKRLYLREMVLEDIEELSKVLSDPESMQYYPEAFSKDKVGKWIQWNIDNYNRYNHGLWAV